MKLNMSVIFKREGAKRNLIDDADKRAPTKEPKHHIRPDLPIGKIVVIADDSIVRGNTPDYLVPHVTAVAKEVRVRSFSPPIVDLCNLGVNIKAQSELLAHRENTTRNHRALGRRKGKCKVTGILVAGGLEICARKGYL